MPRRVAAAANVEDESGWSFGIVERLRALPSAAARRPIDALGIALAAGLSIAILVNALWLQTERHPAPLRGGEKAGTADAAAPILPRPRPTALSPAPEPAVAPAARPRKELLADMQRELARRGFYDGPADGIYGPKMDAAIRDFEVVAKLKPSLEPSEALLQSIVASPLRLQPTRAASVTNSIPRPPAPIVAPAVSPRLVAVQRALAEYGYGQLRATGMLDEPTKAAIEKFERDRRLPITGQVSERLVRELASVTGRPLE